MPIPQSSTLSAWPPFIAAQPVSLPGMLAGLQQSQYWPAAAIAAGQSAQLLSLMEWAANQVPYYRQAQWPAETLGELTRAPERFWTIWRSLPVLTKAELRVQGPAMNAPEDPRLHLPLGKATTSGSTGISVEVLTTGITRAIWNATTLREYLWHKRDATKRLGAIRYFAKNLRDPRGMAMNSWGPPFADYQPTGSAGFIYVSHPLNLLADWLRRFDPHYLVTYPSVAAPLLDELGDPSDKPPSLEEITFISEPLSAALEARVTEEWKIRVSEIYSANETGTIALRCAERGNLHVQSETILVEILDEAGQPCDIGQAGRVVVTPLHNFATPLVRYEIGDYATFGEPCACGRVLPVIRQVLGRVRNLVQTPDGRRYWPVELGRFGALKAVRQAQ